MYSKESRGGFKKGMHTFFTWNNFFCKNEFLNDIFATSIIKNA
jgi:hypothetical protein